MHASMHSTDIGKNIGRNDISNHTLLGWLPCRLRPPKAQCNLSKNTKIPARMQHAQANSTQTQVSHHAHCLRCPYRRRLPRADVHNRDGLFERPASSPWIHPAFGREIQRPHRRRQLPTALQNQPNEYFQNDNIKDTKLILSQISTETKPN